METYRHRNSKLKSEDEAPATGDYEADPDVVRPENQDSSEPTGSSARIPSSEEEDVNTTVPRALEVEVQQKRTSKATSSRRKRGSEQEASETQTQTQLKDIQLAIAKLTGAVEALQATQYAIQAALIAQQPPSLQHQANPAVQRHAFPMAAWPAQQPEHPQTNVQSLPMGRLSQFSSGYQPGPCPLASHSSQHMASSSDAGLQYSVAPRPH
ncbi:hypothetical protein E4U15_003620 [Claviceps sp. LM218 group G6]|nr:hypothetical protein E4U15_003620 [Claviceps sp. LM218 group G6]